MSAQLSGVSLPGTTQPGQLVPSEVAERNKRSTPRLPENFVRFIKKTVGKYSEEEKERDRKYYQRGTKNEMFYSGSQWGTFSKRTGAWQQRPATDKDPIYTYNDFRYYSDAITSQWVQARAELLVSPTDRDDIHATGAARKASHLVDHYRMKSLHEKFLQREGKRGQFYGDMFRYVYPKLGLGPEYQAPQFEEQQEQLAPSTYTCAECGTSGQVEPGQPPQQCVKCGAGPESLAVQEVPSVPMQNVTGYKSQQTVDFITESVPPTQVKFDRTGDEFDDGYFVIRTREVRRELIEELIPWWKSAHGQDSTTSSDTDDPAFLYQRQARQSVGNVTSLRSVAGTSATKPSMVKLTQIWMEPCLYSFHQPDQEVKLGDPEKPTVTIPANTKLGDVFKRGLYVMMIDGEPADFRDESFKAHWSHAPFILVPSKPDGEGIEDLCEPQRQRNQIMSLIDIDVRYNASPPTLLRAPWIRTSDWSGKGHENIPVQGIPNDMKLEDLVHRPENRGIQAQAFELNNALDALGQKYAKAWGVQASTPDVQTLGGDTATGAKITDANSQSQRGPELALRAYGDRKWAEQLLKLWQENVVDRRLIPIDPKKAAGLDSLWLSGADLDCDLRVEVKPRSYLPRNEIDRRNDLMGALAIPGPSGVPMLLDPAAPPQMKALVSEYYNVEVDVDDFDDQIRYERLRLDAMTKALPQVQAMGQQGDPAMIGELLVQMAPEVMPEIENHEIAVVFLKKWMLSDEGIKADPVLKAGVRSLIALHKNGGVAAAQEQQQMAIAAQAPVEEKMKGDQAEMEAKGQEQADADKEHEAGMSEAQMANAAQMSEMDHAKAKEQADQQSMEAEAQRQHEREMADKQMAHDEKMVKMKPKASGGKKRPSVSE